MIRLVSALLAKNLCDVFLVLSFVVKVVLGKGYGLVLDMISTRIGEERIMLREFSTRLYGESYVSERNRLVVYMASNCMVGERFVWHGASIRLCSESYVRERLRLST